MLIKGGCHYVKTHRNSSAYSTWLGPHPPHRPSSELPAAFEQQVRETIFFTWLKKRCSVSGSLTLEPRTTESLSITSTNISLFPPWKNAHKKRKNLELFQQGYRSQTLEHVIIIMQADVIIISETYFVLLWNLQLLNNRLFCSLIPALCWTESVWWLQNSAPLYFVVSQPQTKKRQFQFLTMNKI